VEDVVQAKHVGLDRITQSPILHQPESSVLYTTTTTALMPHISKGRELLLMLDRRGPTPSSSPMEKLLVPSSMTAQTAWHKSFLDSPLRPLNVFLLLLSTSHLRLSNNKSQVGTEKEKSLIRDGDCCIINN
jgi:hypothetical protein